MRRLALKAGRLDFDRFTQEIDLEDIVGWLAFWHLEPFGDEWRQAARNAVTIAGSMGKLPDDAERLFMPNYNAEDDVQTDLEMLAVLAQVPEFAAQMKQQGIL